VTRRPGFEPRASRRSSFSLFSNEEAAATRKGRGRKSTLPPGGCTDGTLFYGFKFLCGFYFFADIGKFGVILE